MDLKDIVKRFEEYASLDTASYSSIFWDNVGLLVEPSGSLFVRKVLITNDLTEPVLNEAIEKEVNLILSYHPAIFDPLKRLTQSEWIQKSIVKCIENRIAVFSPHTTWDSIDGGINDWILQAFDVERAESVDTVKSKSTPTGFTKTVKINLELNQSKDKLLQKLADFKESVKLIGQREIQGGQEFEFLADQFGVVALIELVQSFFGDDAIKTLRIYDLDRPLLKNVGLGRIGYLKQTIKIRDVVEKMKTHLNMATFRIALGNGKTLDDGVRVLAIGAGCASDILNGINADLIITGEFTHHEIMNEVHRGLTVIVTDHTNTERGHHIYFRNKFIELLKKYNEEVELIISDLDRDPLEYI